MTKFTDITPERKDDEGCQADPGASCGISSAQAPLHPEIEPAAPGDYECKPDGTLTASGAINCLMDERSQIYTDLLAARQRIAELTKASKSSYQDGYRQAEFDCSAMGFDAFMVTAGLVPLVSAPLPVPQGEEARSADEISPNENGQPDTSILAKDKPS